MGYTTTQTDLLIGLGASAISDAKYAYAQNEKKVEDYKSLLDEGKLPIAKGHVQTSKDLLIRQSILDIACRGELDGPLLQKVIDYQMYEELCSMDQEGIVSLFPYRLIVKDRGRPFIRNICSVFDVRMRDHRSESMALFSKAI
jgi:oxygen-independent coproporphyrinogen-3 oxidase